MNNSSNLPMLTSNALSINVLQGTHIQPVPLAELFEHPKSQGNLIFNDNDVAFTKVYPPNSNQPLNLVQSPLGLGAADDANRYIGISRQGVLQGAAPYKAPIGQYRIEVYPQNKAGMTLEPLVISIMVKPAGIRVGADQGDVLFDMTSEIKALNELRDGENKIAPTDVTTQFYAERQENPESLGQQQQDTLQNGHPILSKAAQNSGVPPINSSDANTVLNEMPTDAKNLQLQRNPELLPVLSAQAQNDLTAGQSNAPKFSPSGS